MRGTAGYGLCTPSGECKAWHLALGEGEAYLSSRTQPRLVNASTHPMLQLTAGMLQAQQPLQIPSDEACAQLYAQLYRIAAWQVGTLAWTCSHLLSCMAGRPMSR